jgi:hypothetical protein
MIALNKEKRIKLKLAMDLAGLQLTDNEITELGPLSDSIRQQLLLLHSIDLNDEGPAVKYSAC